MKFFRYIGRTALVVAAFLAFNAEAVILQEEQPHHVLPYKSGQLLIKIREDAPRDAISETAFIMGAELIDSFEIVPGLSLYQYDESIDIAEVISAFLENEYVEYAEPDYYYYAAIQNDPRYPELWGLENTGQTGGLVDADINAEAMWQINQGSGDVVIGVIDTGIDYNHPDLIPNLWSNTLDIPGNGIDEDQNGYIDDYHGLNAINNTGNPFDDNQHGTHVSGTIGAEGNNQIGVVGVSQNVQIAACKFLSASGSGVTSDAIKCLQYFARLKTRANNPVNIVATNNSWGGGSSSQALFDAIKTHQNLGILFVAAAGNNGSNNDTSANYPSNYDLQNVIAVLATDNNDQIASFSNRGQRTVHVGAPGVRILSTVPNQGYALLSGTSMATPHVVGLVAVIKSKFPNYDYKQIKNLVLSSGTPLSVLANKSVSGRRIRGADTNGQGALSCLNQVVDSRLKPIDSNVTINFGQTLFLSSERVKCEQPIGALTLYSDAKETIVLEDNGLNGDAVANDGIFSLSWKPLQVQNYALKFGNSDIVTVTVTAPSGYKASPVNYSYETITGTSLAAGDETIHKVSVPFPIHFNGNAAGYSTIYVSSNGTISFTDTTNPGYQNKTLPVNSLTTLVAAFWDDLIPSGTNSNVFVASTGAAPNRHFIVEYRNMRHYSTAGTATFQVVFYENKPDILVNYQDTNFENASYNFGASATVGVETSATAATQYGFNAAVVNSLSSLLFTLP